MKTRTIQTTFWIGDVVYLIVNNEPERGMITGVMFNANNSITYEVTWAGGSSTWCYDVELSTEYVPDYGRDGGSDHAEVDG